MKSPEFLKIARNFALMLLPSLTILPPGARATQLTKDAVVSSGGSSSSASYTLGFSAGLPVVALGQATSYQVFAGFWAPQTNGPAFVNPNPGDIPAVTRLEQSRPNPFAAQTTIAFCLAGAANSMIPARLQIFDVNGRMVRELIDKPLSPGLYTTIWDGCDGQSHQVTAGVYYGRLTAANKQFYIRLVTMR